MSEDPVPTTRAEKRAARDAARSAIVKRGSKRKAEDDSEAQAPQAEKSELGQDFIALPAADAPVGIPANDGATAAANATEDAAGQSTRKARRAARDAERAEKFRHGKKRKLEEGGAGAEDGLKTEDGQEQQDVKPVGLAEEREAKPKESKKRKSQTEDPPKKKRKAVGKPAKNGEDPAIGDEAAENAAAQPLGKQRFIVFLGNLPYNTTDASLQTHFNSLKPFTLRHRTDPKTKKSKGFAFLEFEAFDRMKTCLSQYHHSYFDPESPEKSRLAGDEEPETQQSAFNNRNKKEKGRKINVELTAGGGGKTDDRKEKIRVKNVRLEEQRQRKADLERKEKEKARKEGKTVDAPKRKGPRNAPEQASTIGDASAEGMHPARLAMMSR